MNVVMKGLSAAVIIAALVGCSKPTPKQALSAPLPPAGEVVAPITTVEEFSADITELGSEELHRLRSLGEAGPIYVAAYLPEVENVAANDDERAFASRQELDSSERVHEQLNAILGGCLGQKFIDGFGMPWVKFADKHGTEYALRDGKFEILPFPFVPVLRPAKNNEADFLYALYDIVQQQLQSNQYKVRDDSPF